MRYLFASLLTFSALLAHAPQTFASEWGCEVLLCAASSNPSWQGIESCHPPMEKLISAMKKPGFSWPTCPEGGAGKPGYEPYADCPMGWTATAGGDGNGDLSRQEFSKCMRQVTSCEGGSRWSRFSDSGGSARAPGITRHYRGDNSCSYTEFQDRPRRSEPYFFDIRDQTTGKDERHWFALSTH
ncbi:Hypothetical protein NGAL_HAMBI2427_60720 [Neorhizobium galegae bv. orientalis]|nr:Hypothetical protein NGAL_HAMBI2427_60720 [Neorhizobium galegae bv. orientalis]